MVLRDCPHFTDELKERGQLTCPRSNTQCAEKPGFLPKSSWLQNPVMSVGGREIEGVCIQAVFLTWGLTDLSSLLWCTPLYLLDSETSSHLGQFVSCFPGVLWAAGVCLSLWQVTIIWGGQHPFLYLVRWPLGPALWQCLSAMRTFLKPSSCWVGTYCRCQPHDLMLGNSIYPEMLLFVRLK